MVLLQKGAAFLMQSGTSYEPDKKHLHVVCIIGQNDDCLLVPFATKKGFLFEDDTCILSPYEHSFIKHETYVNYRHAKIKSVNEIKQKIEANILILQDDVNSQVLLKICNGILKSEKISQKYKRYYKENKNN